MRLLDRYLLRELSVPLLYCLLGFLIFWNSFELLSELDDYQQRGMSSREILKVQLIKIPELLVVVLPIALLLALLYSLTNHARHQELTAMRVAGISLWRLAMPYLAVGLTFTIVVFALNEVGVPRSAAAVEAILHRRSPLKSGVDNERWQHKLNFSNARDGRIWTIDAFNLDSYEMKNPHISWSLADGSQRSLIAGRAVRTNDCWTFFDVVEFSHRTSGDSDTTPTRTNMLAVPEFTETPAQIKSEIRMNQLRGLNAPKQAQLSIEEILNYLQLHPNPSPADRALLHTQLQGRLAWPWTCSVVVLIAIPFGASSGRRNLFVGVASSILICFVFFILLRLGLALGSNERIPPSLAAWLPNVAFGALGLLLTSRVR